DVTVRLSQLEPIASEKAAIPPEPSLISLPEASEAHSCAAALLELAEKHKRELSSAREEPRPKTPRALLFAELIALVLVAVGAVAAVAWRKNAGISIVAGVTAGVFAAVALALAVAATVVSRRRARLKAAREANLEADIREAETGAAGLLERYGYRGQRLEAELTRFGMDIDRESAAAAERAERKRKIEDATDEISSILDRYGLPDDGSFTGERIRSDIQSIAALTKEEADYAARKKKADADADEALLTLKRIFGLSGLGEPDPEKASAVASRVRTDNALFAKASDEAAKKKKAAEEYLEAHPEAAADVPDDLPDQAELEKTLSALRGEFANVDRDIFSLEKEIGRRPELEEEAARLEEEIGVLTRRRRLFELTYDYLGKANASLKDRFVRPVREVFKRHAEVINEILGGSLRINDDFLVQFETGGALHDAKYLSTGQQAVAAVCFRTAIVDHIYPDSKPFLILDDPFVDLDATNMKNAARLLREISESYQIIYFCAHESRMITGGEN
ncbi:MAG: hypothetical protein J6V01_02670, partial [Clostridia bacterium]|nr:hypothetical protein [Clostridia bacterium]